MHIPENKIVPIFLRYGVALFLLFTIFYITIDTNYKTITEPYSWDEHVYKNVANNFTFNHIRDLYYSVQETKTISFLTLEKILNNADPFYSRGLNLLLILLCTFLIYKITNNKLSLLFFLIPVFLDTLWLTIEIIEIVCILLSIRYASKSGLLVGIATIFRPTAVLYSLLLKKKQILYVLIIGILFALLLMYLNLFSAYYFEVTHYMGHIRLGLVPIVLEALIMFIVIGYNKQMLGYVIISVIPLNIQMFPHYFLPVYTFLFMGFLLNMNKDMKEIGIK